MNNQIFIRTVQFSQNPNVIIRLSLLTNHIIFLLMTSSVSNQHFDIHCNVFAVMPATVNMLGKTEQSLIRRFNLRCNWLSIMTPKPKKMKKKNIMVRWSYVRSDSNRNNVYVKNFFIKLKLYEKFMQEQSQIYSIGTTLYNLMKRLKYWIKLKHCKCARP